MNKNNKLSIATKILLFTLGILTILSLLINSNRWLPELQTEYIIKQSHLFNTPIKDLLAIRDYHIKIYTGLAAILGLIFAYWRVIVQTRKLSQDRDSLDFEIEKFRTQQLNERFSKAIELLGLSNPTTNIGAIYTLETIANEDKSFYKSYINLLLGFVRSNLSSPDTVQEINEYRIKLTEWNRQHFQSTIVNHQYKQRPYRKLTEDLKTAIISLCNRAGDELIDLSNTNWEGINFKECGFTHFKNFNFEHSSFKSTYLTESIIFEDCFFFNADFSFSRMIYPQFLIVNPYDHGGRMELSSIKLNFALIDDIQLETILCNSEINETIIINGKIENDKGSQTIALSQSSLNNLHITNTYFNCVSFDNSFFNVYFKNCNLIGCHSTIDNINYKYLFLINCNIEVDPVGDWHFFSQLKNHNLPISSNEINNHQNIIFISETTRKRSPNIFTLYNLEKITNLKQIFNGQFGATNKIRKSILNDFKTEQLYLIVKKIKNVG